MDLNGLEAHDELQTNTMSQQLTNTNAHRPKPLCHHCKKPGHYRNQCPLLKKQREQTENNQNNPGNKIIDASNSNPSGNINNNNKIKTTTKTVTEPKTVYPPCETCGKRNHFTENCYIRANAANRLPPQDRRPQRQNQFPEKERERETESKSKRP